MVKYAKLLDDVAGWLGVPSQWLNKYTVVTAVFLTWVVFIDRHNIFAYRKLQGTITRMELQKEEYEQTIAKAQRDIYDLKNNQEEFARSTHLMAKPDEEIILIERK